MATKKTSTLVASESKYIDPLSCDSLVSYKVVNGGRRVWGSVQLADCSRKIEWYFGGSRPSSLAKIDNAIELLQRFREELNAALVERGRGTRRKTVEK